MPETAPPEEAKSARDDVASFIALGASVPFTSSRLLGARIRPDVNGRGFELILANQAQVKGSYVMPWRAMPDIGAPTLFDLRLWEVLSNLKEIHPTAIRHEALMVASEGLAGRLMASAARKALEEEQRNAARLFAQFLAQLDGASPASLLNPPAPEDANHSHTRDAAKTPRPSDPALMASLNALAGTLAGLGPAAPPTVAPLIRLKQEIATMLGEIRRCLDRGERDGEASVLRFLVGATETLLHYVDLAFAETEARLHDMVELLARPRINGAKVLERARRTEWLLDGWAVLVALWHRTTPESRHAIAWDMASLVPPLPREVHGWFTPDQARLAPPRLTRVISQGNDWRTGRNLEITARNEGLIGFTLNYENRMSEAGLHSPTRGRRVRIAKYAPSTPKKSPITEPNDGTTISNSAESGKHAELAANLIGASDENLLRIIAMIDRLQDRTGLDDLLTNVRPRLARLRPPRPLTMMRLLFLPLSGALVNRTAWRQDPACIPRAALKPIFSLLRDLPGGHLPGADAAAPHEMFSDLDAVERRGPPIWDAAARICEKITPGSRWAEAGFTPEDFRAMMRLAAGIWRHAGPLWGVLRQGTAAVSPDVLRTALAGPASEGPDVFRAAFRTLLGASGNAANLAALASGMPAGISEIVIQTMEEWIEAALPRLAEQELIEATNRAEEIGRTLEALGLTPFFQIPRRRQQLSAFFWRLEEHCREMVLEITDDQILPALTPGTEAYSDERFETLETYARMARRIEILGRHFGNDPAYDENQQRVARAFAAAEKAKSQLGITAADLARLAEILLGREKVS